MDIATLQCGMGWFPQQAGGLNRSYYNLVRHLPAAGVSVRGLVTGTSTAGSADVRPFASTTAPLVARWWRARRDGRALLQTYAIDVVASHFALYAFPLLDEIGARPFVVHFHGPWADEAAVERAGGVMQRARRTVERAVYRRADRFVVLSEAFATVLRGPYGVSPDCIRVIPGGVEVDRFEEAPAPDEARRLLGWPADRPILLSVRRLAHRMGLESLIDAVALVRERVPDVLLYIAGRGPIAGLLQQRVDEAGLGDHIRLLGFVPEDDLPLAYRAATLSVVPTQALEGFGLITVESLAAGTPVLVTPVGGLTEAVHDLDPALIFDDASAPAMARGLIDALRGDLPLPSAAACQAYARSRFDCATVARKTRAVYEEVL